MHELPRECCGSLSGLKGCDLPRSRGFGLIMVLGGHFLCGIAMIREKWQIEMGV